jgi:outer membrane receptor protein involved in Fe transport
MNPHCLARRLCAIAAVVAIAATAAAQVAQEEERETVKLSPFEVKSARDSGYRVTDSMTSTGIGADLVKTPLNIQVVGENFLEDLTLDNLHQSLRFISGVQIDEANRSPLGVRIRGFDIGVYYRNGIERRQSFSTRPELGIFTDNVARVEVVKGPVSTFFGQARPGGIVNYITHRPEFRTEGSLKLSYGSYDYWRAALDYQGVLPAYDKLGYRVIVSRQDSEDWRDHEFLKRDYFAGQLRWRPGRRLDVTTEYEWSESRENTANLGRTNLQFHKDWAQPPADVVAFFRNASRPTDAAVIAFLQNRWNRSINNWATDIAAARGVRPATVTTGDLSSFYPQGRTYNTGGPGGEKYNRTSSFNTNVKLEVTPWLNARYQFDHYNAFVDRYQPFANPNGDRTIPFAERTNVSRDRNDSHNLDILVERDGWGMEHRVLVGGQVNRSENDVRTRRMDYTALTPVVARDGRTLTGRDVALFYDPFLHPEIDVRTLIKEVNPTVGLTTSRVTSYYASHQASALRGRLNTMASVRREENESGVGGTVPTFGFTYEFVPGFTFFASRSEAFRVNGPNITGPGARPEEIVSNLPPEKGIGMDFGLKTNWRENTLTGTFSYFTLVNENLRRFTSQRNLFDEPRNLDATTANDVTWWNVGGEERSEGIELDLIWAPRPQYELMLAYSYLWEAKIISDPSLLPGTQDHATQIGRRLTNSPYHQFKVWNRYSFESGALKGLSVGAGVRYVGEAFGATHSPIFAWTNPSYTIFDLFAAYELTLRDRRWKAALTVENAGNHIYLQGEGNVFAEPRKLYFHVSTRL